jgi:hypothetical protein
MSGLWERVVDHREVGSQSNLDVLLSTFSNVLFY